MSTILAENNHPIEKKETLIDYFVSKEKPLSFQKIGCEHEKFILDQVSHRSFSYKGDQSICKIFSLLMQKGWIALKENDAIIALKKKGAVISLEPGGQLELSGKICQTIHEVDQEIQEHLQELTPILHQLKGYFLWQGFNHLTCPQDIQWVPKKRYAIMRPFMEKQGKLGLDMMLRTASLQVNLDYHSQEDMRIKFAIGQALTPFILLLYQNSFFKHNPNYRSYIWQHTDPARSGLLSFASSPYFSYEEYVDYALNLPMYFIYRDGQYLDMTHYRFIDFLEGKAYHQTKTFALLQDWENHLTTIFTEVRLKNIIEFRAADTVHFEKIPSFPAFWVGLLYDDTIKKEIYDIIKKWPFEKINLFYQKIAKGEKVDIFDHKPVQKWCGYFIEKAKEGLEKRHFLNHHGENESIFLQKIS